MMIKIKKLLKRNKIAYCCLVWGWTTLRLLYNMWLFFLLDICSVFGFRKKANSEFAIVIQGPINKKSFKIVKRAIKVYKLTMNGAQIIVSTWYSIDDSLLNKVRKIADEVVLSHEPEIPGRSNVNYQIISTVNGIKMAKKRGAKYVLKVRSNAICVAINLFKKYVEVTEEDNAKSRKSVLSRKLLMLDRHNQIGTIPFGICDFMMMGTIEDMLLFWNIDMDYEEPYCYERLDTIASELRVWRGKSYQQVVINKLSAVQWLSYGFCNNIKYPYVCDIEKTKDFYRDCFVFLDDSNHFLAKYERLRYKKLRLKANIVEYSEIEMRCSMNSTIDWTKLLFKEPDYEEKNKNSDYFKKKNVM